VRGEAKRDTRYSGFVTQSLQLSVVTTVERRGEGRRGEGRGERRVLCNRKLSHTNQFDLQRESVILNACE
jgi:hypothetical protein